MRACICLRADYSLEYIVTHAAAVSVSATIIMTIEILTLLDCTEPRQPALRAHKSPGIYELGYFL